MISLRLYLLGPAQFQQGDRWLTLRRGKAVALLAYVAVTQSPQRREQLIDLLWPNSDGEAARKNLRNRLWDIRQALGEETLVTEGATIGLADNVWVDVHTFEETLLSRSNFEPDQLQAAVALYRAPLLDDLTFTAAPDFELWLTAQRERLGQHYLRLLTELLTFYRSTANWPEVITTAQQALAYDPLQESAHSALMEAYAQQRDRSRAQQQYRQLETLLKQELDVEPLPSTQTLLQAILKDTHPLPVTPPLSPGPYSLRRKSTPAMPFVGRATEMGYLNEELERAAAGKARIVALAGELGIGKTRLWQAWSGQLPAGPLILETRCLPTSQSLPFAPVTRLFGQPQVVHHLTTPVSNVPSLWLAELTRLLPELRQQWPHLPAPAPGPVDEERYRLLEAFTQILRSFQAQPLILFMDDLHWADQATLDWLLYLMDRLANEPFLLIIAYRPPDSPPQLTQMLAQWHREDLLRSLTLDPLTPAETAELVASLGADVTLSERLHELSGGNPYFLTQLSQTPANHLPSELTDLVNDRLKQLSNVAGQVMQAAAVLEPVIALDSLRRTAGRDEAELLDALDELLAANILVEHGDQVEFAHPFVALAVRDSLSTGRGRFLHRRAAEALETTYAANVPAIAGQLMQHYIEAGQPAEAARYADMAAEYAAQLKAHTEAVAFHRQAYTLEPGPTRQLRLGQALFTMPGEQDQAREHLQKALAEFEALNDARGVVEACFSLIRTYLPFNEGEQMQRWLERAMPYVAQIEDPAIEVRIYELRGISESRLGRSLSEAEAHLRQAIDTAMAYQLPELAKTSWFELGILFLQRGDWGQAHQAFNQSLALAQAGQSIYLQSIIYNNLAYTAILQGDLASAATYLEEAFARVETHGLLLPRQYIYSTRGELALATGALDEADTWFNRAIEVAKQFNSPNQEANIRANLGLVAQARGQLDEALRLFTAAQATLAGHRSPHLRIQLQLWLAELYLERGDNGLAEEALAHAEDYLAGSERDGLRAWAYRVRSKLGEP